MKKVLLFLSGFILLSCELNHITVAPREYSAPVTSLGNTGEFSNSDNNNSSAKSGATPGPVYTPSPVLSSTPIPFELHLPSPTPFASAVPSPAVSPEVKTVTVSGTVYDPFFTKLSGIKVNLFSLDENNPYEADEVTTSEDGSFTFTGVPPQTALQLTETKDGQTFSRNIVTVDNPDNNPMVNVFNFGGFNPEEQKYAVP
jgi:hypothetical protein